MSMLGVLRLLLKFCAAACLSGGVVAYLYWPRELQVRQPPPPFQYELEMGKQSVSSPGIYLVAEIAKFRDELFAYMMFQHLRADPELSNLDVLMTFQPGENGPEYPIVAAFGQNYLRAVPEAGRLSNIYWIGPVKVRAIDRTSFVTLHEQSDLFVSVYNFPIRRKYEQLTRQELEDYAGRFIRYKSAVDGRFRGNEEPAPSPLTRDEARRLAGDILHVAHFYGVPVELFLGIGAVENNFMNVRGDLGHSVWKRRAEPGDIVLERRGRRVLVVNDSTGVWQITRETLRFAHKLYLKDDRDYGALPEYLVPPRDLNLDALPLRTLTTYAGLLLRHLVDKFGGDLQKAVAAYNGGPRRPNFEYASGVGSAARHATRMIELAASRAGKRVSEMSFISPPRRTAAP